MAGTVEVNNFFVGLASFSEVGLRAYVAKVGKGDECFMENQVKRGYLPGIFYESKGHLSAFCCFFLDRNCFIGV